MSLRVLFVSVALLLLCLCSSSSAANPYQSPCLNCKGLSFCCTGTGGEAAGVQCCDTPDGSTCNFRTGQCHEPESESSKNAKVVGITLGATFGGIFLIMGLMLGFVFTSCCTECPCCDFDSGCFCCICRSCRARSSSSRRTVAAIELQPKSDPLIVSQIKAAVASGLCTFPLTKYTVAPQQSYNCNTCQLSAYGGALCESCANLCHAGHSLVASDGNVGSYCRCHTRLNGCQAEGGRNLSGNPFNPNDFPVSDNDNTLGADQLIQYVLGTLLVKTEHLNTATIDLLEFNVRSINQLAGTGAERWKILLPGLDWLEVSAIKVFTLLIKFRNDHPGVKGDTKEALLAHTPLDESFGAINLCVYVLTKQLHKNFKDAVHICAVLVAESLLTVNDLANLSESQWTQYWVDSSFISAAQALVNELKEFTIKSPPRSEATAIDIEQMKVEDRKSTSSNAQSNDASAPGGEEEEEIDFPIEDGRLAVSPEAANGAVLLFQFILTRKFDDSLAATKQYTEYLKRNEISSLKGLAALNAESWLQLDLSLEKEMAIRDYLAELIK
jgi:hypothetical protein